MSVTKRGSLTATARGKKKPNDRALMLRAVMPLLSGDRGKALATAIKNKQANKVAAIMSDITEDLKASIERRKT
jgi:hypothetical protein